MRAQSTFLFALLLSFALNSSAVPPAGSESFGNTDGVLTWACGELAPGATHRELVLFAFGNSTAAATQELAAARALFAHPDLPVARLQPAAALAIAWLTNQHTDFALEPAGAFRWRMQRQALNCKQGGQLSQFAWYIHYSDDSGEHRAGVLNDGPAEVENLEIAGPPQMLSMAAAEARVQTGDRKLQLSVVARLGQGSAAALEFVIFNAHDRVLTNVRLSAYANIEAVHTHEGDYSTLDAATAGLLVYDPPTAATVVMAGLRPPLSGFSGVWNTMGYAQSGTGISYAAWRPFTGLPKAWQQELLGEQMAAAGVYLPYVYENPATPDTRRLEPPEAEEVLRRDWLFQSMGQPLAQRAAQEIRWARELAERLSAHPRLEFQGELTRLDLLERELLGSAPSPDAVTNLYFAVRETKRQITFRNPRLDFEQVLFIDQPMPRGRVNPEHEAIHRMGITATPGGRLLVLEGLHPGGQVRQLAPERPGSFWRPDLSFDGQRVLFCFKPWDQKSFHLYEMNLDGSGLRQLTSGDYDDVDPIYLPDGHILFTTTRGNSHVRCGPFIYSYILARCDSDGSNIYLISCNGEPDFLPALLADGRVIYSRWEYSDKPLWRVQSLWTTGQDGTGTRVFWGNQSVWPDHLAEPRAIPGSSRVMFAGVGHHDWFSGSIGIVDPERGANFPHGLTKVTHELRWPECSLPPVDAAESPRYHTAGNFTGYKTPFPLSEQDFLVSARGAGEKFRLYLMDVDGNRELIYEGAHHIWHALPLKARTPPPSQPNSVAWPGTGEQRRSPAPGVFFNSDVYEGVPDLPRGSAKWLRVLQLDYKTYSTWRKTYRHSGPAVSIVQEEGVKRILSEVPVAPDGSVHFAVPPGRALFFQLLDEQFRCLQTMRSFAGLLPSETRGCVGCHEAHSQAPAPRAATALHAPPTPLSPPPWGTESIGYERFVQPVLDRYCGKCHQGNGEARQKLDLTLRPAVDVFKEPYLTLVGQAGWGNPSPLQNQPGYGIAGAIPVESMDPTMNDPAALATLRPLRFLSFTSPLVQLLSEGQHHGVQVDPLSLRRVMAWVDACCPFMGEPEIRALDDPDFEGIGMLPIRPRVKTAPVIERP